MKLSIAIFIIAIFESCSYNNADSKKLNTSINHNDTIISKAYLLGENWLHHDIQYAPIIIPVKNVDIDNMNRFLTSEYFGLGFWTEPDFMKNDSLVFTKLTTIDTNDFGKIVYDSLLIAPVVVMYIEKSLISGNTAGTLNRYEKNGNIYDTYNIGGQYYKLNEFNHRIIEFVTDNRYIEVLSVKPYNKKIARVSDYFELDN